MVLFPKVVELVRKKGGKDILFIGGGIIPKKDIPRLKESGIAYVSGPGTTIAEISAFIEANATAH
jgi:methylmalonyl-CoA mutase C-terminal domain/subunit